MVFLWLRLSRDGLRIVGGIVRLVVVCIVGRIVCLFCMLLEMLRRVLCLVGVLFVFGRIELFLHRLALH